MNGNQMLVVFEQSWRALSYSNHEKMPRRELRSPQRTLNPCRFSVFADMRLAGEPSFGLCSSRREDVKRQWSFSRLASHILLTNQELPRNNDKSLILTCGINKANRPRFDYPDSPWTDGHLSGSAIYQPGSPFLSISPALKKRRHWLRLMSNTWPGQAFPLLPGEVFGLIKRTVFAAKDLGCETERFWHGGRISGVALGTRMRLPLWFADRVSALRIFQKHPNGEETA